MKSSPSKLNAENRMVKHQLQSTLYRSVEQTPWISEPSDIGHDQPIEEEVTDDQHLTIKEVASRKPIEEPSTTVRHEVLRHRIATEPTRLETNTKAKIVILGIIVRQTGGQDHPGHKKMDVLFVETEPIGLKIVPINNHWHCQLRPRQLIMSPRKHQSLVLQFPK